MRSSIYWFRLILLIVLILSFNKVFSQSKFELSLGLGVPEYNNLKLKYGKNIQVGACVHYFYYKGGGVFNDYHSWSLSGEILYHFAGKSKYVEQPTTYLLGGLGYYHNDLLIDLPHEEYDIGFYPRLGRYFNFSKKVGINFDMGFFIPLSAKEDYVPYEFMFLLSGNISFFIRL